MIEPLIYERLTDDSTITSLVGENIYPVYATEETALPFVVYVVTSTKSTWTLKGPTGHTTYTFDVESWAVNFDDTLAIASAVRDAFDGWADAETNTVCSMDDAKPVFAEAGKGYGYQMSFTVRGEV